MIVEEIMSKEPVRIKDNDFVTHARQKMRDHYLRGLPVVNESNRVIGILTDQDILNITSTRSNVTVGGYARECPTITPDMDIIRSAQLLVEAKQNRIPVVASTTDKTCVGLLSIMDILNNIHPTTKSPKTVGKIMTTNVFTCHPDDSITKIWLQMIEYDYTGLPVVSHKNEMMGIITRRDIIRSGYARTGLREAHGTNPSESTTVEKVMSTPAYTISQDTPISKAIEMMLHYDTGRVSVVNGTKLIGIVDRRDVLRACLIGTGLEVM
ncbi:MAG: CBS domain-containing protein [Methanosarcinaceae archaeon]|nr:CBS domain-containing protein [Methanosarcinaceae archaeon]MDF1533198.1 CBS domain-containing protein [Methanosarcinaceae archaeon]